MTGELIYGLPADLLVGVGAPGVLLAAFVLAVMRGWLVPRREIDRTDAIHEARLKEARERAEEWKATALATADRNEALTQTVNELRQVGRSANALMEALRDAAADREARHGR